MRKLIGIPLIILILALPAFGEKSQAKKPAVQPQARPQALISGKVAETMDSGGYTYVRLVNKGQSIWVAVPETKVTVGKSMSFLPGTEMVNFQSKTLNRTFERLIFSAGPATGMKEKSQGSKALVVDPKEKIKVDKASGVSAYTISELYANRAGLNNKEVIVKAKVVKVSAGIMGRNWIHLQDGTGDSKAGTHNLVATSNDLPSVGEVVTVRGILHKDRNFGGGYIYSVIVENAVVKK